MSYSTFNVNASGDALGDGYTLSNALVEAFDNDLDALQGFISNSKTNINVNISFDLMYNLDPQLDLNDGFCSYDIVSKSLLFAQMVEKLSNFVTSVQDHPSVELYINMQIANLVEIA